MNEDAISNAKFKCHLQAQMSESLNYLDSFDIKIWHFGFRR